MNPRGLSALALLFVATAMERCAYYGSRSFLTLDLLDRGETAMSIGTTMAALQGLTLLGMLVGAGAAFAVGPRATAVAGTLIAAVGHFLLASGTPIAGAAVVGFGAGVFRPCPFAVAAETIAWDDPSPSPPGPHRFSAVAAFAVAIYGAINAGGLLGPMLAAILRRAQGSPLVYSVNGAVMILATAITAVALVVGLVGRRAPGDVAAQGPYRMPETRPESTLPPRGTMLNGVALLIVPHVVYLLGISLSKPPYELASGSTMAWLFSLNPIVVTIASMGVFALLLAAAIQRWTLPPLVFYGAGLTILAAGLLFVALAGSDSMVLYAIGAAVAGLGEAVAGGVPIAYAAIAARGRGATLLVAGWLGIGLVVSSVSGALAASQALRSPLIGLSALLCLGGGIALVVRARPLHQTFFNPKDPAEADLR